MKIYLFSYFTSLEIIRITKQHGKDSPQDLTLISSNKLNHFPAEHTYRLRSCTILTPSLSKCALIHTDVFHQLKGDISYIHVQVKKRRRNPVGCLDAARTGDEAFCGRHGGRLREWVSEQQEERRDYRSAPRCLPLRQWRRCSHLHLLSCTVAQTEQQHHLEVFGWNNHVHYIL